MYSYSLNVSGITVSFSYDSVEQVAPILSATFAALSAEGSFLSNERAVSQPIVVFPSSSSSSSSDTFSHVSSVTGHKNTRRNFRRRERRRRKKQIEQRDGAFSGTGQSGAIENSVSRVLKEQVDKSVQTSPLTVVRSSTVQQVSSCSRKVVQSSIVQPFCFTRERIDCILKDISLATDRELEQLLKAKNSGVDVSLIEREIDFRKNVLSSRLTAPPNWKKF